MRDFGLPHWKGNGPDAPPNVPLLSLTVAVVLAVAIFTALHFLARVPRHGPFDPLFDRAFSDFCDLTAPLGMRMAAAGELLSRDDSAAHPTSAELHGYCSRLQWIADDPTEPLQIRGAARSYLRKLETFVRYRETFPPPKSPLPARPSW
ncbi:MAG: hypothetical protein WC712_00655 [Candidatus Brocadiia bacterium]